MALLVVVLDLVCRVAALLAGLALLRKVAAYVVLDDLLCRAAALVAMEKPRIFFVQQNWFPEEQDISDGGTFLGFKSKGQTSRHLDHLQFLNTPRQAGKSGSCASSLLSTAWPLKPEKPSGKGDHLTPRY